MGTSAHTGGMILIYILLAVYIAAVNFFAFLQVKSARDDEELGERGKDGKLFLTGLLGGAVTVYVSMFVFRYRLNNVLLMVLMPVLAALNIYLFYLAFRFGGGIFLI